MFILDTSAIIELLHGTSLGECIKQEIESSSVAKTVFSKYEIRRGVRNHESALTSSFLEQLSVLPFDLKSCGKKCSTLSNAYTIGKND